VVAVAERNPAARARQAGFVRDDVALEVVDIGRVLRLRITEHAVQADHGRGSGGFVRTYAPPLRLVALGHGEDLTALVRLADAFGVVTEAFAPDTDRHAMTTGGIAPLTSRTAFPGIAGDDWTAFVFLFHDHDWEEHLLPRALAQRGFYHGAVGSARTHRARVGGLRAAGVPEALLNTLRSGIGLIPATRDPATLALSILSELVQDYQACAGVPGWTGSAPRAVGANVRSRP
jgi:xanthine dehydrogenase accessory factor